MGSSSWGNGIAWKLGHGDEQKQTAPKRVEALRGIRVSVGAFGWDHALALTEDGLVYAWGENTEAAVLGDPNVERQVLPKPVEALRGVRVGSIAAFEYHGYAVADTGEL
jgi:alpha-tubulin suppressor-like RCC1 family protein